VRRVVLGTTDPEGWVGGSERGEGWRGCPLALLHLPPFAAGEGAPAPSFVLAGISISMRFEIADSICAGDESVIDRAQLFFRLETAEEMLKRWWRYVARHALQPKGFEQAAAMGGDPGVCFGIDILALRHAAAHLLQDNL